MIYGYLYQILMKLSHRFNWHHMKPNPYLEHGKIHLWCHWCGARSVLIKEEGDYTVPLYTHPVKELTIEEIDEVSKEIFKGYKDFYHYQINFARAILRKAQEK